ncbi:MAG: biopolymer transporter ExbD [Deltaproteobacteria bacterium]|nr:biopolymer transporter ExbD [Deltaproteobacteria bacterium]
MAGGVSDDEEAISAINITPLVDVVLVLLVIFMVTANLIVNKGMKVQLPEASTAEALPEERTLNVTILQDGTIQLDGQTITLEVLQSTGRAHKEKGDKVIVMLGADKNAKYDHVVRVMNALREVEIVDFGLQLQPTSGGR